MRLLDMYDTAIIGGGPAGVTAAIYAKRAGLSPVIFEKTFLGGQTANTDEIENYPALGRVSGADFAQKLSEHAALFDISVIYSEVNRITKQDGFVISTPSGEHRAKTVIITTGAVPRKLNIEGEGLRGVSYCAVCDGNFYKDKNVCVIGGGNTAVSDAIYLSKLCKKVYLVHRRDAFRAQSTLVERMTELENVKLKLSATPVKILGQDRVRGVIIKTAAGESEFLAEAVFVAIGTTPAANFIEGIEKDETGAIITDAYMRTSIEGVFAAGDARKTPLKQVITACADGAVAAVAAAEFVRNI